MWRLALPLWTLAWSFSIGAQEFREELVREDPSKIVTAQACGECHIAEFEVWNKTTHATGFKTLHRKASAESIRNKMGLRLIKRDAICIKCHYTPNLKRGQLRAEQGISCESCHGAGADWIDLHNDYGKGFDHSTETPEHRTRRIEDSRRAGMLRPSDFYPVVNNCFDCHMVPEEKLVNVGGHSIGSGDFELVAWSQGVIRHNFLQSFITGEAAENVERSLERKRPMYVVGRAVALEHSLRGVASATEEGVYLKAMQRRVRSTLVEIRAIALRAEIPETDAMIAAVRGVQVKLGNSEALLAAAAVVGEATRGFLDRYGLEGQPPTAGESLASLDALVLGLSDDFEDEEEAEIAEAGDPASSDPASGDPASVDPAAVADGSLGGTSIDPSSSTPAGTTTSGGAGSQRTRRVGAVAAVGEKKTKIRPASRFKTLGPGACSKCHSDQNRWWSGDAHSGSVDPFFDEAGDNVRIARFYGLKPSQMLRGDNVCMDCHGSVISGREKRSVQDGVGCESCHGPAAEYKEPHQEGEKSLGTSRPGYKKALGLGMNELQSADVRARTCTSCHYITEPRLISAGHPSGKAFDYLAGMDKINHWESDPAAGALKGAFVKALGQRGQVPKVQLARLGTVSGAAAELPPPSGASPTTEPRRASPTELARSFAPRPQNPSTQSGRPDSPVTQSGNPSVFEPPARSLDLPPFPEIDENTSIEETLILLKQRFELLYRKVYQEESGRKP